jgi:hypothetical protein
MRELMRKRRAAIKDQLLADAGAAASAQGRVFDEIDVQVARQVREAETLNQRRPVKLPSISEQAYVESWLGKSAELGVLNSERKARAERYARWKYRGFCQGVVASL